MAEPQGPSPISIAITVPLPPSAAASYDRPELRATDPVIIGSCGCACDTTTGAGAGSGA